MKKRLALTPLAITVLLISLVFPLFPIEASAGNLGVGLRVLPGGDGSSNTEITGNTKLWFVVKQGASFSRELILTGSSSVDQKINLSLVQLARVDGEPSVTDVKSEILPWVTFSDNDFLLKRNTSSNVILTVSPPTNIKSSAFEAYLIVTASGLETATKDDGVTKAVLKNSARVAQPVFVGVGSYEEFKIDFEIKDVEGKKTSTEKFLRIYLDNRGKTPISPSGQVQLKNMDFEQGTIGPLNFYASTIQPKSKAFVDVILPPEVNPGNWKIFVRATQGSITVTREFDKNLTFTNSFGLFFILIRLIILLAGIALSLWIYRTFKPRRSKNESGVKVEKDSIPDETKALIAQLEAKAAKLEAQVAKTSATKKTTKKAATKVVSKKSSTNNVTSARPKKAAVKKVAKKSPSKDS